MKLDFSNQENLAALLEQLQPEVIFHLSGQSSVQQSWKRIPETFMSNVTETIHLYESVTHTSLKEHIRIISVGSSEEYGKVNHLPITETTAAHPVNPYGVSKLAVGNISRLYSHDLGLDIVHTRPFNHIGPGQHAGFVTSDFARQVALIELELQEPTLLVGDLSSKRDFTDVRDIVEAYRLMFEKGTSGEIYNVCSGTCVAVQNVLDFLVSLSSKKIEIRIDSTRLRPNDVPEYYGSNEKIKTATGWNPSIPLAKSLEDIYTYWKEQLLLNP